MSDARDDGVGWVGRLGDPRPAMSRGSLTITHTDGGSVSFDDETHRVDPRSNYFASVTLTSADGDTSWGEFLTREDVEAIRKWADILLDS